jgi:transcriptional regulator with XRE-family HTH domain
MTQVELAKALGVNQSAVTQWESGLTSPRLDKLQAMAALFKCSIDELVREDE